MLFTVKLSTKKDGLIDAVRFIQSQKISTAIKQLERKLPQHLESYTTTYQIPHAAKLECHDGVVIEIDEIVPL